MNYLSVVTSISVWKRAKLNVGLFGRVLTMLRTSGDACVKVFPDGLSFRFLLTAAALIQSAAASHSLWHSLLIVGCVFLFFSFLSNLCRCVSVTSLAWRRSVLKDHPDKIMAGVVRCRQTHILMGAHLDSCHASRHCPCVLNIVGADSYTSTAGCSENCLFCWVKNSFHNSCQQVVYLYSFTITHQPWGVWKTGKYTRA